MNALSVAFKHTVKSSGSKQPQSTGEPMNVSLSPIGGVAGLFLDNSGKPLAGGLLYSYSAGTSTAQATYSDSNGATLQSNPIVLDSGGRVPNEIWLISDLSYTFVLKTSTGTLIGSWDNITGICASTTLSALGASAGSVLIGFLGAGAGAAATTVQAKLRQTINVKDFGAVGDGVSDDTAAIQKAVTYAFGAGCKIEIDGNGGEYTISTPIIYPAGSLVTLRNMKLVAAACFDKSKYMVEVTSQKDGLCNHDLSFEDLIMDASHRGGCLLVDNYIRVIVSNCTFLHFSTCGIRLDKTKDSHECLISKVWAFEFLYGEPGFSTPTPSSTGLQINSPDNEINQYVSYYTGRGIVINAHYNLISQAHVGCGIYALYITQNAAWTSINQCYIDSASVLWENPWNTEFSGCKFLTNTETASFAFVIIRPMAANTFMRGAKITQCSFHNMGSATVISVKNDASSGWFDYANLRSNYIENNSFNNTTEAYTRLRTSSYKAGASLWTFNLANYFPIGSIQKVTCSYYCKTSAIFPISVITSISGTDVTVSNSIASNGTMFIDVDVNVSYS